MPMAKAKPINTKAIMTPEFIHFQKFSDARGALVALEQHRNIPFTIKRTYYIFDNLKDTRRGFHAHLELQQVAVCVKGSCSFLLDNGRSRCNVRLNSPTQGLYIGNAIWREMYDFSSDCVLLVLASELFEESDYIRSYDDFIQWVGNNKFSDIQPILS